MPKIDVGAGVEPKAGFLPVDLYADGPGYIKAPMWDLPFPDGFAEEINCSHTLEHAEKRKIIPTLKEFHRVLKEGGKLTIEVPDLRWVCENWLAHQNDLYARDQIFGNQDPPGGQFHLCGWNPDLLRRDLWQAGFHSCEITIVWSHAEECIRVECIK